jgi:2,3-bisphosphoglycerate-dependent phosphoglycerate mutase
MGQDASVARRLQTLILLRHGESEWNRDNRFAGWVDVPLTVAGADEARLAGELLVQANCLPDVVHTSLLVRSIRSAALVLEAAGRNGIEEKRTWRFNERHYGILQGRNRDSVVDEFGYAQFHRWRRSYTAAPPPVAENSPFSQASDARYANLRQGVPRTESLQDVLTRLLPHWRREITPDLAAGKTVLVVTHGNTMRAIVKYLQNVSDNAVEDINIPTAIPMVMQLNEEGVLYADPVYLDPVRAAIGSAAVASLGRPEPTARSSAARDGGHEVIGFQ